MSEILTMYTPDDIVGLVLEPCKPGVSASGMPYDRMARVTFASGRVEVRPFVLVFTDGGDGDS